MILLTLLTGCNTDTEPEESAKSEPITISIPLNQPPPPSEIVVVLPELEGLAPELEPIKAQVQVKENEAARQALDAWLADHPDDANAWFLRGESFMTELKWPEADADFEKAIAADDSHAPARKRQIGAKIGQRDCDTAMPLIETYRSLKPDDPEVLLMRSYCRGLQSDHPGALADAKEACEQGFEGACTVVPKLEGRLEWIEKKTRELEAEKAAAEATGAEATTTTGVAGSAAAGAE